MKRVLIADDMPTVYEQAREIIGSRYEVSNALTGDEIVEAAKRERPDVILLDMFLDEEMSEGCADDIIRNVGDLFVEPRIEFGSGTGGIQFAPGVDPGSILF